MKDTTSRDPGCVFCRVVARQTEASVVHEDETVLVFLDLHPVTPGHLLVVPRQHVVGLDDLGAATGGHVWEVAQDMSRALRRSSLGCEGINLLVCDGETAFQTVFHFHLHVIPRYRDDGWTLSADSQERERFLLERDAQAIRAAL